VIVCRGRVFLVEDGIEIKLNQLLKLNDDQQAGLENNAPTADLGLCCVLMRMLWQILKEVFDV